MSPSCCILLTIDGKELQFVGDFSKEVSVLLMDWVSHYGGSFCGGFHVVFLTSSVSSFLSLIWFDITSLPPEIDTVSGSHWLCERDNFLHCSHVDLQVDLFSLALLSLF